MTQDLLEKLQAARAFSAPRVFRRMHEGAELEGLPALGDRVKWWSLRRMARWQPPSDWRGASDAVPFAQTANGDLWCWYPGWATGNTPPIVLVTDHKDARLYAPTFEGFLFRQLLDQLSGVEDSNADVEEAELETRIASALELVRPYLRSNWLALLDAVRERPLRRNERTGRLQFLEPEEAREIVQRELPFDRVNPGLQQVG